MAIRLDKIVHNDGSCHAIFSAGNSFLVAHKSASGEVSRLGKFYDHKSAFKCLLEHIQIPAISYQTKLF